MNTKKNVIFLSVVLLLASMLSGCVFGGQVNSDEMGAIVDGGYIREVAGPGVYWKGGFYEGLAKYSVATLTFSVTDTSVATADTQLVGVTVTIQAQRKSDPDSVRNILTNWTTLEDNKNLQAAIESTVSQAIKVGVRSMTLEQLLSDRVTLSTNITNALVADAAKYSVNVILVTVKDVALDPSYMTILEQKANLTAQTETAAKQQDLIRQQAANDKLQQDQTTLVLQAQLLKEQAQTQVNVEIASRAGKVTAASQQVYRDNPQAFQLKMAELTRDTLNGKTVYFLPAGTNLSLLMNSMGADTSGQIIPVPVNPLTSTTP